MAQFGGIIFDLDGTLMDTLADLAASGNFALQAHGFAPVGVSGYRYHVGNGLRTMVRRAVEASLEISPRKGAPAAETAPDDVLLQKVHDTLVKHYDANWHNLSRPYPGVTDMLQALAGRDIPFAVCSNKPDAFVKEMVGRYFAGLPFIDALGQREGVPLKPDTTGTLLLARAMGLSPARIVFAGDTKTDMLTANSAGMFAAGVSWGFRPRSELLEHGARMIADSPAQLVELLQ